MPALPNRPTILAGSVRPDGIVGTTTILARRLVSHVLGQRRHDCGRIQGWPDHTRIPRGHLASVVADRPSSCNPQAHAVHSLVYPMTSQTPVTPATLSAPAVDVVNVAERARTAIGLGESHFREFKSALDGPPGSKAHRSAKAIAKDIGEALVAFANADGGELLVGVEDDGTVSGVDSLSPGQLDVLEAAPTSHVHAKTPLPPIRFARLTIESLTVLYYSIHKSTAHVHLTSDGRCVQRRDLETVPIPPEEILLGRRERESREYDRGFVDGATPSDLHHDMVKAVADQLSPGMSVEKCLQYLDLAEYLGPGLRLRRAALLLFARDPIRWHPRIQIRILKVEGTDLKTGAQYNVKSDQTVSGNILELIEKGWEGLRPQLVQTRLGNAARFESTVMYPELACREALVNAIAHRDYSDEGRGIEIFVFHDRMEVRNPGALLSSISVADLLRQW